MADIREKLARLNPTTIKFDVGNGGGTPDLTNIDIAGALAFVAPGIGREVLEACWWPDGAALRSHKLRDAVIALVEPEVRRQQKLLAEARIEVGLAQACMGWAGAVTAEQRQELERARGRLEALIASCWPRSTMESLPTLAGAVLAEIATANHCELCAGRAEVIVGTVVKVCEQCSGRGIVPVSDRKRAAAISRDEAVFRRNWREVYIWVLDRMREAEQNAASQLAQALRREVA